LTFLGGVYMLYRKSFLPTPWSKEFSNGKEAAFLKIILNKSFLFILF
jgi:hypothetical protein